MLVICCRVCQHVRFLGRASRRSSPHAEPVPRSDDVTAHPPSDPGVSTIAREVSVIVPARAAGATISRCLQAITQAEAAPGEVIVVIDGRDDELAAIARSFKVSVIELARSAGAGAARNAGAALAHGSILFFVDADVVISPSAIGEAAHSLREHPEWSAVFGSYDDHPGAHNLVSQYKGLLNHYVHQTTRGEASTFWTAMGAIRKGVFLNLGGFDESSRLEDIELGYRLRSAGHRIGFNHHMFAKHLKRWTIGSLIRSDIFDRAIPWTELILGYRNSGHDLNLDSTNRRSVVWVFVMLGAAVAGAFFPIISIPIVAIAVVALLVLNRKLYGFFYRSRGLTFVCRAILLHWLYYFYGGLSFLIGWLLFHLPRHTPTRPHRITPAEAR